MEVTTERSWSRTWGMCLGRMKRMRRKRRKRCRRMMPPRLSKD